MNTTLEFKHYFDRLFVNLMKIIYRSAFTTLHTHAANYENDFNFNDLLLYTQEELIVQNWIKIGYDNNKNCHQGKW